MSELLNVWSSCEIFLCFVVIFQIIKVGISSLRSKLLHITNYTLLENLIYYLYIKLIYLNVMLYRYCHKYFDKTSCFFKGQKR